MRHLDWDCPQCGFDNYGFRDECQRCRAPRPGPDDRPSPVKEPAARDHGQNPAMKSQLPHWDHGYYAPGNYAAAPGWNNGGAAYYQRDYAMEKPEAYKAFLAFIRPGSEGPEVNLSNNMCQDHHVDDLLACLESFLMRHSPRPWRVGRLNLARNGLSDASVVRIMERLKIWSLRLRRLDLDFNHIGTQGLAGLVEFIWNCPEVIYELGLSGNALEVNASDSGNDQVSALLRCLYNHPGYPLKTQTDAGVQIVPFMLRLGENRIAGGKELLDRISEKGGRSHVHFCLSADPYACVENIYLSVFLPSFEKQELLALPAHPPIPAIEDSTALESTQESKLSAEAPAIGAGDAAVSESVSDYSASDSQSDGDEQGIDAPPPTQGVVAARSAPPTDGVQAVVFEEAQRQEQCDDFEESEEEESVVESAAESDPAEDPEEVAPERQTPEKPSPDAGEAEDAEIEMPDDVLKALDILDAAADAQIKKADAKRQSDSLPVEANANAQGDNASESPESSSDKESLKADYQEADDGNDSSEEPAAKTAAANDSPKKEDVIEHHSEGQDEAEAPRAAGSKKRAKPLRNHMPPPQDIPLPIKVASLKRGVYTNGRVTLLRERFALVDCGLEVEALLHKDDLSSIVESMTEVLNLGDVVHAEVSGVCCRRNRVSLRQVAGPQPGTEHATETTVRRLRRKVRKSQKRARQAETEKSVGTSAKARAKPKHNTSENGTADAENSSDSFGGVIDKSLLNADQRHLEDDIIAQIEKVDPSLEADLKSETAQFVVEMLKEKKRPSEVEVELRAFFKEEEASEFVNWLRHHIQGDWLRATRSRAGATARPKAGAKRAREASED